MSEPSVESSEQLASETKPETNRLRLRFADAQGGPPAAPQIELSGSGGALVGVQVASRTGAITTKLAEDEHDQSYDVWAENKVAWEEGCYVAKIYRDAPETVLDPSSGRYVPCKGKIGELRTAPTLDKIKELFGGGRSMHVEIDGPDPTGQRHSRTYGRKAFSIAADPKIPSEAGMREEQMSDAALEMAKMVQQDSRDNKDRLEKERQRSEGAAEQERSVLLNQQDRMLALAQQNGEVQAAMERARAEQAERKAGLLEQRLSEVDKGGRGQGGDIRDIMQGIGSMLSGMKDKNGGSPFDVSALRDLHERHDRALSELRQANQREIDDQRVRAREAVENERETRRKEVQDARDEARRREEDLVRRSDGELKRAVDYAQAANKIEVQAKQARIDTFEAEVARLRGDLMESKNRAVMLEKEVGDLRTERAELKAELSHRPKGSTEEDAIEKVARMKRAVEDVFGESRGRGGNDDDGDDEKPKTGIERFLDVPVVHQTIMTTLKALSGEGDKERATQVKIAAINVKAEEERTKRELAAMQLQHQRDGRRMTVKAGEQPSRAAEPTRPAFYQTGDESLPDPPLKRELKGNAAELSDLMLNAEMCVRQNVLPPIFLDGLTQSVPLDVLYEKLFGECTSDEFLADIAGKGGEASYPVLYHPSGRRWMKVLWEEVDRRVDAGSAPSSGRHS
jgi:hypothetical protein